MAALTKVLLSGCTNGRNIPVVATATAGTLIHTAIAGTSASDAFYLWAANVTASTATLTVEWGGVTDPGDHMVKAMAIPPNSPPIPVVTGQILNNGLVARAFGGTASAINITGFIVRNQ